MSRALCCLIIALTGALSAAHAVDTAPGQVDVHFLARTGSRSMAWAWIGPCRRARYRYLRPSACSGSICGPGAVRLAAIHAVSFAAMS